MTSSRLSRCVYVSVFRSYSSIVRRAQPVAPNMCPGMFRL